MGHCIHAIVAPSQTADVILDSWPEIPRLDLDNAFAILPIDADLIDNRIVADKFPSVTGDEFALLTNGLRNLLRQFSCTGQLAYVETDYFGGSGGQGALVCRDGVEIMPPTWQPSGIINVALKLIGIKKSGNGDRFSAIGLGEIRSNDDLLKIITKRNRNNNT